MLRALLLLVVIPAAMAQSVLPLSERERTQGYRDHVVLAKVRDGEEGRAAVEERNAGHRLRQRLGHHGELRLLQLASDQTPHEALVRMRASGRYEFVEPDYIRDRQTVPDDPRFAEQWHLHNTGQGGGTPGADIAAQAAWAIRTDASNVIVAVIDTGVRLSHEDLVDNLWTNPREIPGNGIDDDGNGYIDDVHGINVLAGKGAIDSGNPQDDSGHGTFVSSLIGATGGNAKGIAGVAWKVRIMPLKFDDAEGRGLVSKMVECVDYAIANGAQIINFSYGGHYFSQAEFNALERARNAGIIVVLSAGNSHASLDSAPSYPASYLLDNLVSVAATDRNDALAAFSNYGSGLVELAAPGVDLVMAEAGSDSGYGVHSGTSFSAPLVAGALALVRANFPDDSYRDAINRVLAAADRRPGLVGMVQAGRLNVGRALATSTSRPNNDDFSSRIQLQGDLVSLRANTLRATSEAGEPVGSGGSLWWTWTAPHSGRFGVDTTGSEISTALNVYTGTALATLSPVTVAVETASSKTARISFAAVAGATYQIALAGVAPGGAMLTLGYVPNNDQRSAAEMLSGPSVRAAGFNSLATADPGEPLVISSAVGRSVWYKWTAPATRNFSCSLHTYGFDGVAAIYAQSASGELTKLKSLSLGAYNEPAFFDAITGQTYYFQVDSAAGGGGPFNLVLSDVVVVPATLAANSSPAYTWTTRTLFLPDSYGDFSAANFATEELNYFALDGQLDVQTPALGPDGSLYIGDESGYLYAYGPDLVRRWRKDLGLVTVGSSPALGSDGAIHVHTSDGYLHAYHSDGTPKWRVVVPGDSYASPAIGATGVIYLGSSSGHVYALLPNYGQLYWTFRTTGAIYASVALDEAGNLHFGTLEGKFYSVSPGGHQRWMFDVGSPVSSSAAIAADGTIYFGAYDGNLYALTADGKLRWRYPTGGEIRASSPAIGSDGSVYIGSYDGYVHVVGPDGTRQRVFATAGPVRSSPMVSNGLVAFGSADSRNYVGFVTGGAQAGAPWPMHRQNSQRTGRRAGSGPPVTAFSGGLQTAAAGGTATLAVAATGAEPMSFQWYFNGAPVPGATRSSLTLTDANASNIGWYSVVVSNAQGRITTSGGFFGLKNSVKQVGAATEFPDIVHAATGAVYDQILMEGPTVSVKADPGQIVRVSYVDPDDDIVQVEFSGDGTLTLVLEEVSGPAKPVKYNQEVRYMKGRAQITIAGATARSNVSIFSVGRANSGNANLFPDAMTFGGMADVAMLTILTDDGMFGGLRAANAIFSGSKGAVGVYSNANFTGPVYIGDIKATGPAEPTLIFGGIENVRITGGNLAQPNGKKITVYGVKTIEFADGSDSHGNRKPAQANRGEFQVSPSQSPPTIINPARAATP